MSEDAVVAELRAIRDLQILRLGEEAEALTDDFSDQHLALLSELDASEWEQSTEVLEPVADQFNVTKEAVRQKKDALLELGYIEQKGQSSQTTAYRKTGLGLVAERAEELLT